MKLWLIKLKDYTWDEYSDFVVAAKDKKRAWEVVKLQYSQSSYSNIRDDNVAEIRLLAKATSEPEGEVLASFHAG
jgi:hypothetical protein